MKVYTLCGEYQEEENSGGYQSHEVLLGVFPSDFEARFEWKNMHGPTQKFTGYFITEWDI